MKRFLAMAAAAFALTSGLATAAQATVLYTETGTFGGPRIVDEYDWLFHPGLIELTFTSSTPIQGANIFLLVNGGTQHLTCNASSCTPDGSGWSYQGWNACLGQNMSCIGDRLPVDAVGKTSFSTTFQLDPEPALLTPPAGTYPQGSQLDDTEFWNVGLYIGLDGAAGAASSPYTLTFSTVDDTVPEPAVWAMMITGLFGLGAMLRRTRTRNAALA